MGLFRRRGKATNSTDPNGETQELTPDVDPELQGQAQEVMKDNLELMREVVMKIREDPEYASNIYANCPRLQHLLDQYPDLRPIFEDPKLVRINFEQVYRDAGGVLPEDEQKKKSWLVWIVNSPCFKVLKLLLLVKKFVACIAGGGFACIAGCLMCCCCEDAVEEVDADDDPDAEGMDPAKEALNRAADHMEDPEVQEHMQALLEDPDNLQEAIDNDPELSALRDSNPLCGELMSDPETMRVLTDPDNLRALGECPELIQADFIDPDGFTPSDFDAGGMDGLGDTGYDAFDGGDMDLEADNDFEADIDFEDEQDMTADDDFDDPVEPGEEEEGGWWEDAEMQDTGNDAGPNTDTGTGNENTMHARAQARSQQQAEKQAEGGGGNNGRFGGIFATIGAAATDLIAAQIVGSAFSSDLLPTGMLGGGGGGGGGLDSLDAMGGGGGGDDKFESIGNVADNAGAMIDDDVADVAKETVDETKEQVEDKDGDASGQDGDDDTKTAGVAAGAAASGGAVAGGAAVATRSRTTTNNDSAQGSFADRFDDEEEEKPKSKSRFGVIGNFAQTIATKAKEQVATSLLGDGFGEQLVERMEGGDEEDDKKGDEAQTKKRGFFRRGAKEPE